MTTLDRRLHAFRPDLADAALQGQVEAARFVTPEPARIALPVVDLHPTSDMAGGIDTQLLLGEDIRVFERAGGIAWVQAVADGYVGYLPEAALGEPEATTTSSASPAPSCIPVRICVFPAAIRSPWEPRHCCRRGGNPRHPLWPACRWQRLILRHLRSISAPPAADYVSVAALFLETPYLWGGKSGLGIDCSGLVQLSMAMAGLKAPRDSDMQAAGLGRPITREELRRGDLVFWKGHAAIMEDAEMMIHANGHTMTVARETLADAIERIGWLYGTPTGYRRPVAET